MTALSKKAREEVPDFGYLTDKEKHKLNILVEQYYTADRIHGLYQKKNEARLQKLNVARNKIYHKINEMGLAAKLRKEQQCDHKGATFWQCYRDDCSYANGIHSECTGCGSSSLVRGIDKEKYGKAVMTRREYEVARPILKMNATITHS